MLSGDLPEEATAPARHTMAAHINAALHDELARRPETLMFGMTLAARAASTT